MDEDDGNDPKPSPPATTADQECSIKRFGALTMFNAETHAVEVPCKYLLADFECGSYRILVRVRNERDPSKDNRFSPDVVRVKVITIKGRKKGDLMETRTTTQLLVKVRLCTDHGDCW